MMAMIAAAVARKAVVCPAALALGREMLADPGGPL